VTSSSSSASERSHLPLGCALGRACSHDCSRLCHPPAFRARHSHTGTLEIAWQLDGSMHSRCTYETSHVRSRRPHSDLDSRRRAICGLGCRFIRLCGGASICCRPAEQTMRPRIRIALLCARRVSRCLAVADAPHAVSLCQGTCHNKGSTYTHTGSTVAAGACLHISSP